VEEARCSFTDDCGETGEAIITFFATDECGNTSSTTATFTIEDTIAPIIECDPEPIVLCNDDFGPLTVNWADYNESGAVCDSGTLTIDPNASEGNNGTFESSWSDDGCTETGYYHFTVTDDCGNPATQTCEVIREIDLYDNYETAYAYYDDGNEENGDEAYCFIDDPELDANRWGWTNYFECQGEYEMELYAGAAHCDLDRGTLVGSVTVIYSEEALTVVYNMDAGYVITEAHLFAGCEKYPRNKRDGFTLAPGQYPYNGGEFSAVQNYSIDIQNPERDNSGGIYVIAHAVTAEIVCMCSENEADILDDEYEGNTMTFEGGFDCEDTCAASTSVIADINVQTYPVPFDDKLNVRYNFEYDTNVKIEVYDMKGVRLHDEVDRNYVKNTSSTTTIDMTKFDNQLFFVKVSTNKDSVIKKVVSSSLKKY